MFAAATVALTTAIAGHQWPEPARFAMLMLVKVLASRLKVKLPGLTSSMAFNLPLLLLAAIELPYNEAVSIAAVATAVACFPFTRPGMRPIQTLFNIATVTTATALTDIIAAALKRSNRLDLVLPVAGLAFLIANVAPVATIIAVTEQQDFLGVLKQVCKCSFPSFVLSTGLASLLVAASRMLPASIGALVVLFGVWHCYKFYFGLAGLQSAPSVFIRKTVASAVGARQVLWIAISILAISASCSAQGIATDTSHSLTIATAANGKLHAIPAALLTESAALFGNFSANASLQYYARTLSGGQITVQAISDFGACASPATAPSIACNTVHYTCGTVSFGSACSSTVTLSTSSATTVLSLPVNSACMNGGSPCGATNPFTLPLSFTATNDPYYKTASYSATLQFTLSAL
jgi:hypothetical protein